MSTINETESLKNLRSLIRPYYDKRGFVGIPIAGFEDMHDNIGRIMLPCSSKEFHTTAVQIVKLFRLVDWSQLVDQQTAHDLNSVCDAMEKMNLNTK